MEYTHESQSSDQLICRLTEGDLAACRYLFDHRSNPR
jgi:hypothetical protein